DAEGPGGVAAHVDGDPGRVGGVTPGRQGRGEDVQGLEDLDLGGLVVPGPVQQGRQRADVVGAEDDVHPGGALDDRGAVLLRQAPTDGDLQIGVGQLRRAQLAQVAVELVGGVLTHGARVEDHDVGHVRPVGRGETGEVDI